MATRRQQKTSDKIDLEKKFCRNVHSPERDQEREREQK